MQTEAPIIADWIAADWGGTRLRVWAMAENGAALASAAASLGMNKLSQADYEPALLSLVSPWLADGRATPALLCGMVGAKQGWRPAPYGETPADLTAPSAPIAVSTEDARLSVRILPGLSQADPPDVMRGEETLLAGLVADDPGFDGLAVLPGTHSKWARIRDGRIEAFATYMTGELYSLLAETSMLRHSVATEGWSDAAFESGLRQAVEAPAAFSNRLFTVRAEHLLADAAPEILKSRLSGLVIGLEIANALAAAQRDAPILIIADAAAAARYENALALLGRPARRLGAEQAALAGLTAAYRALAEQGDWE